MAMATSSANLLNDKSRITAKLLFIDRVNKVHVSTRLSDIGAS
jgi:hypothetical protein